MLQMTTEGGFGPKLSFNPQKRRSLEPGVSVAGVILSLSPPLRDTRGLRHAYDNIAYAGGSSIEASEAVLLTKL